MYKFVCFNVIVQLLIGFAGKVLPKPAAGNYAAAVINVQENIREKIHNPHKMTKKPTLFALFLTILGFAGLHAQDFEVAPVRVHFNASPGESQIRTVTVKNHGNYKETISMQLRDYLVNRQGTREVLSAGSTANSLSDWVNLNPSFLELQPNESATVQINLQAPADEYDSKWGIISFTTTREQTVFSADVDMQSGVSVTGRIDIFMSYNPDTGEPGNVSISNLHEVTATDSDERRFSVNLDNLGERITPCKVFLVASNMQTGEEYRFGTVDVNTYPQTSRRVELTLPADLEPGTYSLAAILDYPGSESLKGTQITIDVE